MLHTHEKPHNLTGCQTYLPAYGKDGVVIMRSDIIGGPWSPCSKADFQARYLQVKDSWCMEGKVSLHLISIYF